MKLVKLTILSAALIIASIGITQAQEQTSVNQRQRARVTPNAARVRVDRARQNVDIDVSQFKDQIRDYDKIPEALKKQSIVPDGNMPAKLKKQLKAIYSSFNKNSNQEEINAAFGNLSGDAKKEFKKALSQLSKEKESAELNNPTAGRERLPSDQITTEVAR